MSTRRQLAPFAALSATYFAHVGFFNPYLPLWLQELGLGVLAIGFLSSVQSATRLVTPYFWGWLSDHTGRRVRWLRYCAGAATVSALGLWGGWGLPGLTLVLLLMFVHTSAMMPLSEAALAHWVSQGSHFDARRYGRVRLWGSLGFLFTVVVAGGWFERYGMASFPAWALLTLLAVWVSVWSMPGDARADGAHQPVTRMAVGPTLRLPVVRWFLVSVWAHVLAHVTLYVFFSLYLDGLGYSKTVIGLLWATSVVVEIAWFLWQGRWLSRLRLSTWLVVAAVLTVVRMVLIGWGADGGTAGLVWLLVAQCFHAVTFAAHHTVCVAVVSQHFPGALRARGQALYTVVGYGLTGVMAGLGGGWMVHHLGMRSVFMAAAASAVVAAVAAWRMRRCEGPTSTPHRG